MNNQAEIGDRWSTRRRRFFSNPIVGIAGSIASVLGILLSTYFYSAGKERPNLTYYVHPVKAAVFRTGQASSLRLTLDDQPVERDITATQIAFWNAGTKPIRQDDVLRPLTIRTSSQAPIIEARIRKTSRDVVRISLDDSNRAAGEVRVTWNILEGNDGGVIQLIYQGDESNAIVADAVVAGQSQLSRLEFSGEISSPANEYERRQSNRRIAFWPPLIALFLQLPVYFWVRHQDRKHGRNPSVAGRLALPIIGLLTVGFVFYFYFSTRPLGPPFGF